jgi:hypothetical protein
MHRRLAAVALALFVACAPARAGTPVVVELFTSQGCGASPPADAYLAGLAEQPGVIALAFHVDYWDYLGWQDTFANPAFSKRQRNYAKAFGERMVYTPQMVVGGRIGLVGSHIDEIEAAIAEVRALPSAATVRIERQGDGLRIAVEPGEGEAAEATVSYLLLAHPQTVEISRGENRDQRIVYRNMVRGWMMLGRWHGGTAEWPVAMPQDAQAIVVLVQAEQSRAILGAARHVLGAPGD